MIVTMAGSNNADKGQLALSAGRACLAVVRTLFPGTKKGDRLAPVASLHGFLLAVKPLQLQLWDQLELSTPDRKNHQLVVNYTVGQMLFQAFLRHQHERPGTV